MHPLSFRVAALVALFLSATNQPCAAQPAMEPPPPDVGRQYVEPPAIPATPPALDELREREEAEPELECIYTLEELEALACQNNPTLRQAKAQVDGTFGKAIQAGLWPNPIVGYVQEQIGVADTPGEFVGAFVQQEFVTADKRDLSRAKFLQRTRTAEWLAMAQEYRVLNDIRMHFWRTMARRRQVHTQSQLLKNAEDRLLTTREMYNVGQVRRSDVHTANAILQEQRLNYLLAQNDLREAWETLTALVGVDLPLGSLDGDLEGELTMIEWDTALVRILNESPEIQAANAKLRADRITLQRERVEPIPNITVRGSGGHNYEAMQDVANLEISLEVPLFDRNQGTIRQAQADLVRQRNEVRRTELDLRRRLAQQYRTYLTAFQHVENYQEVVLPESRNAYVQLLKSYRDDRVRWMDVLDAERRYYLRRAEYNNNLMMWREAEVMLMGYLLHGGLQAPPNPTPPGHIDAVPQPR